MGHVWTQGQTQGPLEAADWAGQRKEGQGRAGQGGAACGVGLDAFNDFDSTECLALGIIACFLDYVDAKLFW